ncbi:hypothetical protein I8748_19985 [Nostoc sp. CENA67]|uniref:Uncharacterized protein n=1 Tax=Amazonocrinis nigriterrae CENA67 TaxID=2794033 RepID=A0A8J7HXW1_9NOST|nr:hypothetical protein [Amazonocrinis nigriterrae]MBH8564434.1 hypothetical protein [Amazonocrinis nigriterrae CENA67]
MGNCDRTHSSEETGAIAPLSHRPIQARKINSDRLVWAGMRSHIYYVFSSTLLASCSEAMTERCKLPEKLFYSVGSTTGDLWLFCSVDISFKLQNTEL